MRIQLKYLNSIFPICFVLFGLFTNSFCQSPDFQGWRCLIPSEKLPPELQILKGNNNLDVTKFQDRYYFAFRTAPSHFASKKTLIYIISTSDRQNWRYEKRFFAGADMREPRFCATDTALFFYFFEGGKNPMRFQPNKIWACHLNPSGTWTEKQDLGMDGFVPWRIRLHQNKLYMSAYDGRNLYNKHYQAELRLFQSVDGYHWAAISEAPQIGDKGGEEGEFIFDDAGNLWGTVRLEGAGAQLVFAPQSDIGNWQLFPTDNKYDSALLFKHDGQIYLISRRNLDGNAAKKDILPPTLQRNYNLVRYSLTQKCTAIWLLDQENKQLIHLADFPSTGDTAFPGIVEIEDGKFWLFNYSSRIDGPRKNWLKGQLGRTYIYETELNFNSN